jgi:hypothetical protein
MAKRDSMSKARQSRNPKPKLTSQNGHAAIHRNHADAFPESLPENASSNLMETIRMERSRLMKAEAVLGCVAFALLYEEWLEAGERPCFADAVIVALDLVTEAAEHLTQVPSN